MINHLKDIKPDTVCFNIFNVQVKHVTTHRSEPRGLSDSVYNHGPVTGAGAKRSVPESFQPGVIVQ